LRVPTGAQKRLLEFTERRSSETCGPSSSGEGPRGFCACTRRVFEMRCAGKRFRGRILTLVTKPGHVCTRICMLCENGYWSPVRRDDTAFPIVNSSRGMFVTDPLFRTGANFHELVPSFLKGRDDSAT
jgi:hypothetical protein